MVANKTNVQKGTVSTQTSGCVLSLDAAATTALLAVASDGIGGTMVRE